MNQLRQIANLANARFSTGPVTQAGKDRASQNALTHGLAAKKFTIKPEEQTAFDTLHSDMAAHYKPANEYERSLLRQAAEFQIRIQRALRIEQALLHQCANEIAAEIAAISYDDALALAFTDPRFTSRVRLFLRYQSQVERNWRKAISQLESVIKARKQHESENAGKPAVAPPVRVPAAAPQTRNSSDPAVGFVSHALIGTAAQPASGPQQAGPGSPAKL